MEDCLFRLDYIILIEGMRQFTEEDVRRRLPMSDAIAVLRRTFAEYAAGRAHNQPRRRLYLESGAVLHSLAGACGPYFGTKVYATHAKHGAWFTVLLYDAATARPLAQFEANWLGQIRTGAVSGLATHLLVPEREVTVGCIGSGFQAQSQLQAIAAVRKIASVKVWSRRAEKREQFAAEMGELLKTPVRVAADSDDAVNDSQIVVTATYSKEPVIAAEAVAPGTLVLAMGSNHPQRRELPAELVQTSAVCVEDIESCRNEAGDLLLAVDQSEWGRFVELKHLVAEPVRAKALQGRTVVFKSVGMGLEDVAVAGFIYERAGT